MDRIMDYNELFNERGEQLNIVTDATIGGDYHRGMEVGLRHSEMLSGERTFEGRVVRSRRTPVRYLDFDTFADPEQTAEESVEALRNAAILFASVIVSIVGIVLLL